MSPDHPQKRPRRTRKIVGKPHLVDPAPALAIIAEMKADLAMSDWSRFRSWLADRLTALARWVRG